MYQHHLVRLVVAGLACPAVAGLPLNAAPAHPGTACFVADHALPRKQQLVQNMLPSVVFANESLAEPIATRMRWHKVPALSVAAIHKGKLDWTEAWGELKIGGAAAGCGSLFQAGSLSKPVTVLAALRMKQQGLIDFDQNIETYLKSYHLPAGRQTDAQPVTLRNLFTHTAGITPGGYAGYPQLQSLPTDQQTVRAETPSNARKVEVLTTPGTQLAYSGGGYTVAEIALQDQLLQPFEQLMRQWLFVPAGMKQADFTQPLPSANHTSAASGYRADGSGVPGGWHNHPEQAAAGLWATPSDLSIFLLEIRKGYRGESKIFSQASIRELLAKPVDGHAYGFRLIGAGDQMFITHYGGTVGYRAGMTINLSTGDGAVFMSNSDSGSDLGHEFLNAMSRVYHWPEFREEQVRRKALPVKALQSLTGQYEFTQPKVKVSVVYENQALTLLFPNGDRYAMTPIQGAPFEFIHAATAVRISFAGDGADLRLSLYGQTGKREATTVP